MLCVGESHYGTLYEMDDDKNFYKAILGITISIPSRETFRQHRSDIGCSHREQIFNKSIEMLLVNNIQPSAFPDEYRMYILLLRL